MPKERGFNPVQAQRKAEKAKAVKKGKAEANSRRNEKLAKRNPERIQKQIDDLKNITTNGGKLSKHEESVLDGLERELKSVNKAREALGDNAPTFGRGGGSGASRNDGNVLGKRRRGWHNESSDDSDVPDDVKSIPMPRDTPPPIPKPILDEWYAKRRANRNATATNANDTPLGERDRRPRGHQEQGDTTTAESKVAPPTKIVPEAKTVYEAQPVVRNLRKEAVSAFVPTAVRMKLDKAKGQGALMDPEEADRLEREGYLQTAPVDDRRGPQKVSIQDADEDEEDQ